MKMNKLAAGALALALGLGAVAPSVAAEKKEYTGAQLFLEQYEKELKKANEKRLAAIDAQAKIDAAQAEYDAAVKEYEAALKAYKELNPVEFKEDSYIRSPEEVAKIALKDAEVALNKFIKAPFVNAETDVKLYKNGDAKLGVKKEDAASLKAYLKTAFNERRADGVSEDQLAGAVEQYVNELVRIIESTKEGSKTLKAYQRLKAAQFKRDEKKNNLDEVKVKYQPIVDKYDAALKELKEKAYGYGFVVQVGNNGLQLVKPEDSKVESPKKFNIEQLKAARAKALTTLDAVKLLEELAPQKIAGVKAELNKLVEEQKALIKLADKYLAKEMALVSTAYAAEDEEEMSPEELTNKLNEKSDKIQDLIKDKEEDKKPEEKPEDKKPEEKKPEENKPAKKSGNNARTGIAGVAGVAGILAAASVAYAASKRD